MNETKRVAFQKLFKGNNADMAAFNSHYLQFIETYNLDNSHDHKIGNDNDGAIAFISWVFYDKKPAAFTVAQLMEACHDPDSTFEHKAHFLLLYSAMAQLNSCHNQELTFDNFDAFYQYTSDLQNHEVMNTDIVAFHEDSKVHLQNIDKVKTIHNELVRYNNYLTRTYGFDEQKYTPITQQKFAALQALYTKLDEVNFYDPATFEALKKEVNSQQETFSQHQEHFTFLKKILKALHIDLNTQKMSGRFFRKPKSTGLIQAVRDSLDLGKPKPSKEAGDFEMEEIDSSTYKK